MIMLLALIQILHMEERDFAVWKAEGKRLAEKINQEFVRLEASLPREQKIEVIDIHYCINEAHTKEVYIAYQIIPKE
jgi:hypothetical protein